MFWSLLVGWGASALKEEWLKLYRVLANMRNRRGKLMPGWIALQQKPIYTIKSQLVQWRKMRHEADAGSDRRSTRHHELLLTRATHPSNTKRNDARRWVSRGCHGSHVTSDHGCSAGSNGGYGQPVATAAPPERTTEQKSKRRRQHDDDDLDGATSESPTLTEIDSACADHDASAASAALPRATTAAPHSGSDDGYGRIVEAAADGGRVLPAHNATQSRRPRRRRPPAAGCPGADPDDHS